MFVVQQTSGLLHRKYRDAGAFRQSLQLLRLYGVAPRIANDYHRALGPAQDGGGFLDQFWVALGTAGVAVFSRQIGVQLLLGDLLLLKVYGQSQMHRAGPAGHGGAEGRGDKLGYSQTVVDQPGALGYRSGHGGLVDLLKSCHPLLGQLGATGYENYWALRGVYSRETGYGVGEPRAAGKHAHRGLACDSGIGIGHMHGRAFVAGIDEFNPLIGGRVHQGKDGVADDGKHPFDALLLQAPDEQMGPGNLGHGLSLVAVYIVRVYTRKCGVNRDIITDIITRKLRSIELSDPSPVAQDRPGKAVGRHMSITDGGAKVPPGAVR